MEEVLVKSENRLESDIVPIGVRLGPWIGYATIAVIAAILFFFLVLPVGVIVRNAFVSPEGQFTLAYFKLLFQNSLLTESIVTSLSIGLATTIFTTILCLPLAAINARLDYPGKAFLSGLLLVPMVMPPFVGAIGIQRFFAQYGTVNLMLIDSGWIEQPIDWLSSEHLFWVVVALEVLHLYPIMYLNLTAALANIDPSLEEMASTLGVNRWKQLRDIVWPLARPGYFAGATIVFIWALTDLGTPLLVGFHETMPVRIFNLITDVRQNPVGFALVFLVIAMTALLFAGSRYFLNQKNLSMMARGHVTSPINLAPRWSWLPIYAVLGGTVMLALLPHLSVLMVSLSGPWMMTVLPDSFTYEHYAAIWQTELPMIGIKNSIFLASVATLIDLILGLLIAYVVARKLVPMAGLLDSLVMIPLALPGIVLAFGYVVTYSGTWLDPMHNPVPLLLIAYGIRRLPYMVRAASAGLQQISVSLEEASASFGASRFHTLRKITGPLVMANLIAGALLCFAYSMLDVSDSLILAMKDQFYPLTKVIYVLFLEQGRGEFVSSALGIIGMLILTVCILSASLILGKKMGELFRS